MDTNLISKLGRVWHEDVRDKSYQLSRVMRLDDGGRKYKYWWSSGWWGDQGYTPQCVGYSWTHWLAEGPITQNSRMDGTKKPIDPSYVYTEAQKVDVWPGESYDGTSVRAGAKILQREGYISNYYWAWTVEDIINTLLTVGPMVVGTTWKYDMFFPNKDGIINATGSDAGGHAYLLDGISLTKNLIRIKNSWGRSWGHNGFAYISIDDMQLLMANYGEACIALELDKE